ncbi:LOW QUALITY PROTEIN: hypothetical protein ACJ73_00679 [Blastomyces percursus]|uniref:Uncharacterized protein n=1 Tax=Blastomyces percursus TaxID=1658174 RepID=A0A1J9QHE6_9EURO|nr:LOW QUALITY PROTEIN: hypothetical protein ACJ73_00679 [Blastomyces percursus]
MAHLSGTKFHFCCRFARSCARARPFRWEGFEFKPRRIEIGVISLPLVKNTQDREKNQRQRQLATITGGKLANKHTAVLHIAAFVNVQPLTFLLPGQCHSGKYCGPENSRAKWPDHGLMEPYQPPASFLETTFLAGLGGEVIRGLGTNNHHDSNWHELLSRTGDAMVARNPGKEET